MTTVEELTQQDIEEFQLMMKECASDPKSHLDFVWPYILPGLENHLPPELAFDEWEDEEQGEDGLRCARLRKTLV